MAEAEVNTTEEKFYSFCYGCKMGYRKTWLPFISISSEGKLFQCVQCKIRFSFGFKMKKWYFDDTYPHRCEVCEKRYEHSSQLLYHSYHHTGAWPFKCHFCGIGFAVNSLYESHLITRTVQCRKCCASFQKKLCSARLFHENDGLNCKKCSNASNLTKTT
ncbi:hypothetical protein TNCT_422381 [Trichonephila clavata]|uniref:C2H2-type domain-containing protein n=1 Tax=Trichonephila clavata TaxID=2740835 RepID=A0A8X6JHV3_TRICU|nr:hypothetical protein TNCT_422381 [Trichonephila clavata]